MKTRIVRLIVSPRRGAKIRNAAAALSVSLCLLAPAAASGPIFVSPTGADDSPDPRDPATPLASLTEAVERASWGDFISVGAGTFTESGICIEKNLTISGAGAGLTLFQGDALPCAAPDRIIRVKAGVCVRITDLHIARGFAQVMGDPHGGGCMNEGDLELQNVRISDCDAGPSGDGGGCWNGPGAKLDMYNCWIGGCNAGDGEDVVDGPGQPGGNGGACANQGELRCNRATFSGCTAGDGGSGSNFGGNGGSGGGCFNWGRAVFHCLTVSGCCAGNGGAGSIAGGSGGSGGAIDSTGAPCQLGYSTITANKAGTGSSQLGGAGCGGGCHNNSASLDFDLYHCIIADNIIALGGCGPDVGGTFDSQGYNAIGDTGIFTLSGDPTGNVIGTDPLLGPLLDNGGLCPTHLPGAGSVAINGGDPSNPNPPAIDARGFSRPGSQTVDIGAVEVAGMVLPDFDSDGIPDNTDPDKDGDGMADAWEADNGLDPDNPGDAVLDKDGDGHTNANEHAFCTDPCDPASHVRLAIVRSGGSVQITLSPTFPDKKYSLRISTGLGRWDGVPGMTNLLTEDTSQIFTDGFESGDVSAWSATTP